MISLKKIIKYYISVFLRQVIKFFWILPITNNQIIFRSFEGDKYNCNPKYISEYLMQNFPEKFKIIWLFSSKKKINELNNKEFKAIKQFSLKGIYYFITSKIIIENFGHSQLLPVRSEQWIINCWHGNAVFKKNGVYSDRDIRKKILNNISDNTKIFVSPSLCNSNNFLRSDLNYKGEIMNVGSPRNDILFRKDDSIKSKVRNYYKVSSDKMIVLYAPTYREVMEGTLNEVDIPRILDTLKRKYNKEFVFFIRMHKYVENNIKDLCEECIITNDYDDMQELIYSADIMISDYSACLWDYSLTGKPCFVYANDIENYVNERGFYIPIELWPFPIARNNEELITNIMNYDIVEYNYKRDKYYKLVGNFEKGNACKFVADRIEEICGI